MHDENLHIAPDSGKGYPQPDVPVDDAWNQMESMLDTGLPSSSPKGKMKGGGSHFWTSTLIIAGVAGIITWGIISSKNNRSIVDHNPEKEIYIDKNDNHLDTVTYRNPEIANDSMTVAKKDKPSIGLNAEKQNNQSETTTPSISIKTQAGKIPHIPNNRIAGSTYIKDQVMTPAIAPAQPKKSLADANIKAVLSVNEKDSEIGARGTSDNSGEKMQLPDTKVANINITLNTATGIQSSEKGIVAPKQTSDLQDEKDRIDRKNQGANVLDTNTPAGKFDKEAPKTDNNITEIKEPASSQPTTSGKSPKPSGGKPIGDGIGIPAVFKNTHIGLAWNMPLPFNGTDNYFSGYKGEKQAVNLLVPGAWVSKRFNKHEIMLSLNPLQQHFTGNKLLKSTEILIADSTSFDSIPTQSKSFRNLFLLKTFGFGVGLNYNYKILPSLIIGAGVHYHTQSKALLLDQNILESNEVTISNTYYGIKKQEDSWEYLKSDFFTGQLEMAWRRKIFDAGVILHIPLNTMSSSSDVTIKPISGQVFFRLKIK